MKIQRLTEGQHKIAYFKGSAVLPNGQGGKFRGFVALVNGKFIYNVNGQKCSRSEFLNIKKQFS